MTELSDFIHFSIGIQRNSDRKSLFSVDFIEFFSVLNSVTFLTHFSLMSSLTQVNSIMNSKLRLICHMFLLVMEMDYLASNLLANECRVT